MHDIKAIRENPEAFKKALAYKLKDGAGPVVDRLLSTDQELRAAQTAYQTSQARRNDASKQIGQAKAQKDDARAQALMDEVEALKVALLQSQDNERRQLETLRSQLSVIPNIPFDDVPIGDDESGNQEIRKFGAISHREFTPKDHADLGEGLGLMDFAAAARMSGARFVVTKGALARLERAIGQFMLDIQTTHNGYLEVNPPLLVRDHALYGTGQLPKFEEDLFKTTLDHYLIPTAEVSLTNLVRESLLSEEELPLRLTALTPCFRAEAGSAGRDTKGMIRQHQFNKVELVSITTPEQSQSEHERMVECAEGILKTLGLSFRTMLLCTGDMGFGARKTYDLEVWLPSQDTYREISSCSNCGDFQARRMEARYRPKGDKNTRFLHSLNGSGLAVGRTLVAIMENYQDEGGRIFIPEGLQSYMSGATHIERST
jgi:seryl-tRNA synthetase